MTTVHIFFSEIKIPSPSTHQKGQDFAVQQTRSSLEKCILFFLHFGYWFNKSRSKLIELCSLDWSAVLVSDGCDDQFGFPHSLDPLCCRQLLEHVSLTGARPHDSIHQPVTLPLCEELHCVQPFHIFHLPAYLHAQAPPCVLLSPHGRFAGWRSRRRLDQKHWRHGRKIQECKRSSCITAWGQEDNTGLISLWHFYIFG